MTLTRKINNIALGTLFIIPAILSSFIFSKPNYEEVVKDSAKFEKFGEPLLDYYNIPYEEIKDGRIKLDKDFIKNKHLEKEESEPLFIGSLFRTNDPFIDREKVSEKPSYMLSFQNYNNFSTISFSYVVDYGHYYLNAVSVHQMIFEDSSNIEKNNENLNIRDYVGIDFFKKESNKIQFSNSEDLFDKMRDDNYFVVETKDEKNLNPSYKYNSKVKKYKSEHSNNYLFLIKNTFFSNTYQNKDEMDAEKRNSIIEKTATSSFLFIITTFLFILFSFAFKQPLPSSRLKSFFSGQILENDLKKITKSELLNRQHHALNKMNEKIINKPSSNERQTNKKNLIVND